MLRNHRWTVAGWTLAGGVWLLIIPVLTVIYRGLTQSLAIDEAYTYHLFLNQKASALFNQYDAAYDVLHTCASWLAVHKFGKSEAILRLPSMLAGLAYLAGVGVLSHRIFGATWRFPIAVALLSTHPLIADYLSAARGYGAALAFFVWSVNAFFSHRIVLASVLLSLSTACNLTFIVPSAAAGAAWLLWELNDGANGGRRLRSWFCPSVPWHYRFSRSALRCFSGKFLLRCF